MSCRTDARRRTEEPDEAEREAVESQNRLKRLADRAASPFSHPAVHRLARQHRHRPAVAEPRETA